MAVYLFTWHAYRSWMPDKPRGYVRDGEGVQPPDAKMAAWYRRDARADQVWFDGRIGPVIAEATRGTCGRKGWRLHQVRVTATHVHALVSWRGFFEWKKVSDTLKRCIGAAISKALDRKGPWLSRGESRKRVKDGEHFAYLMDKYLPEHGGWFWREDGAGAEG